MAQGFLPFQYESDRGSAGETSRAGLLVFVELFRALGLLESVRDDVGVRRNGLGYTDWQVVLALMLLNLAGGDCVADLDVLEGDAGFCRVHRALETHGLTRRERKDLRDRFPGGRERTVPSSSAVFRYLSRFHVEAAAPPAFKAAVAQVPGAEWRPLSREEGGRPVATGREWAEVCFVPNRLCSKKRGREYRYLATREVLAQPPLPGLGAQLALFFPTLEMDAVHYKLFGVVTNREGDGGELILWHDERSGRSEGAHAVMKNDLAGGTLPSGAFGENAAWWTIMILAFNLHTAMKRMALGEGWGRKRLKALRFHFINLPGRVLCHAGRLIIRLAGDHPSFDLLVAARQRILALSRSP
jgi:hypothetical protein